MSWQEEIDYLKDSLPRLLKRAREAGEEYDPHERDYFFEVYRMNEKRMWHLSLCKELELSFQDVYYSGEHLTLLQMARRLTKNSTERELRNALRSLGYKPGDQVYFWVTCPAPDLAELEPVLFSILQEKGYIAAKDFYEKLQVNPNTKYYTYVKKELREAGWVWRSRRIGGQKVKVVEPPADREPQFLQQTESLNSPIKSPDVLSVCLENSMTNMTRKEKVSGCLDEYGKNFGSDLPHSERTLQACTSPGDRPLSHLPP